MIKLNGREVVFGKFPNGETYADVEVSRVKKNESNSIYLRFEDDTDIFHLMCVKDFVDDNAYDVPCHLIMPYVPYSRMDRQEEKRLFTLKTFAKFINSMNFSSVVVLEPHSEVTPALINRVKVVNKSANLALIAMRDVLGLSGSAWFDNVWSDEDFTLKGLFRKAREAGVYLVYPDAGAEKRYSKQIAYDKVLTCSKHRDFNTGNIDSLVVNGADNAQDCKIAIIVDDLCSKGTTFKFTAEKLREVTNVLTVVLCVTHCEKTIYNGDLLTGDSVDYIYTTDSIIDIPVSYDEYSKFSSKLTCKRLSTIINDEKGVYDE
jgi:ribose-phosphate pyrophosphokinase